MPQQHRGTISIRTPHGRQFLRFLLRVDLSFRRDLTVAISSALVSIFGFVFSWASFPAVLSISWDSTLTIAAFVLGLISAALSLKSFRDVLRHIQTGYAPDDRSNEYFAVKHTALPVSEGQSMRFSDLRPSATEAAEGFAPVLPNGSIEVAFSSPPLNAWLSTQPKIKFDIGASAEGFVAGPADSVRMKGDRLAYLKSLVIRNEATNEAKYRLAAIPKSGATTQTIQLQKVGYYDAMVSNQCVAMELRERPWGTDQDGTSAAELRDLFPLVQEVADGDAVRRLAAYGQGAEFANSVGVSTLVVSRDGYPVFFHQKGHNIEGADKLTVLGSGSADFADIEDAKAALFLEGGAYLLDVAKFGMVREAMEEGSVIHKGLNRTERNERIKAGVLNTRILGFFRWVSRAGKPEFIGVTRLDLPLKDIKPDNVEVARLEQDQPIQLHRMSDFLLLQDMLVDGRGGAARKGQFTMGLSSAMVMWRLGQIAERNTPEDIALCAELAELIGIENT